MSETRPLGNQKRKSTSQGAGKPTPQVQQSQVDVKPIINDMIARKRTLADLSPEEKQAIVDTQYDPEAPPGDELARERIKSRVARSMGPVAVPRADSADGTEEEMLPIVLKDADSGFKSRTGPQKRDDYGDKQDFQKIAQPIWEANPKLPKSELVNSPELAAYKRKYPGPHTLRDWLTPIDPRPPERKRGPKPIK